jgi:hypothetical protein
MVRVRLAISVVRLDHPSEMSNCAGASTSGQMIPKVLLVHLSPLKWEHINWTGDYHWRRDGGLRNRKLRPTPDRPLHRPRPFLSVQFFTKPASEPPFHGIWRELTDR